MRKSIKTLVFSLIFCLGVSQAAGLRSSALWNPPQAPTCNAVYLINTDTNTVMYAKNQNEKIYPASTTKMMTAILVYEKFKNNLKAKVTVERDDITPLEGKFGMLVPLKVGEEVTIEELLNCMLIKSGDDSADTLARATAGSIDKFAELMNAKAKAIGAKNTHYVNPHGLHDPDQYTTAHDSYIIAKYMMQYDALAKIVATSSYTMPATNKSAQRTPFINTNYLIDVGHKAFYYQYVKGIKTGTTTPAGACLVSYAERDGKTYYCVAMGGKKGTDGTNTAFSDTRALYKWVFGNFEIEPIVKMSDTSAQVKVDLAAGSNNLILVPQVQLNALVPDTYKSSDLKIKLNVPATVKAPIKKGQVIGKEELSITDPITKKVQNLGTVNLVASAKVDRSMPLYILSLISGFFRSKWFKVVAILLVLALVVYISLSVHYNRQRNKLNKRRRKKYRGLR